MTLFIFSVLILLSTKKQSVVFKGLFHAPKLDFVGTFMFRFFEDGGPNSAIYVSLPKDLDLIVCCQSNI